MAGAIKKLFSLHCIKQLWLKDTFWLASYLWCQWFISVGKVMKLSVAIRILKITHSALLFLKCSWKILCCQFNVFPVCMLRLCRFKWKLSLGDGLLEINWGFRWGIPTQDWPGRLCSAWCCTAEARDDPQKLTCFYHFLRVKKLEDVFTALFEHSKDLSIFFSCILIWDFN